MTDKKTVQKNWRFSPETIMRLQALCEWERRSEANMVEVLIDRAFQSFQTIKLVNKIESIHEPKQSIVQSGSSDVGY